MKRTFITLAVKLTVAAALLVLLFRPSSFGFPAGFFGAAGSRTATELPAFSAGWLAFAVAAVVAGALAGVLRWRVLLEGQGIPIPFLYLLRSWFAGSFFGAFLPSTSGLDMYRLYDSARFTEQAIRPTAVIVVEKLLALVSLVLWVLLVASAVLSQLHVRMSKLGLGMVLVCLGVLAAGSLIVLLHPHPLRVVLAVAPAPPAARKALETLGAALAAYKDDAPLLLRAVAYGLVVRVSRWLMYFGVMMAIRTESAALVDVLCTSSLVSSATVLWPAIVSGSIRETAAAPLLEGVGGIPSRLVLTQLVWLAGRGLPCLLGALVWVTRPGRKRLEALGKQPAAASPSEGSYLSPAERTHYGRGLLGCVLAGVAGGMIAGAVVGLAEATWVCRWLVNPTELNVFWWAPLVYGVSLTGCGMAVAAVAAFYYLLTGRFRTVARTFALCFGGTLAVSIVVIGRWRFTRDVLDFHPLSLGQILAVLATAAAVGLAAERICALTLPRISANRRQGAVAALCAFVLLLMSGVVIAQVAPADVPKSPYQAQAGSPRPNICLVALDTLRADYLPIYSDTAEARTPNLDAFGGDAVVFRNCVAQANWTKPSFATMLTGLYPSEHGAVGKMSILPDDVTTLCEVLVRHGYYTQGFANNENIKTSFGFHQGFVDYTDLIPNLYLGASPSAAHLCFYGVIHALSAKLASLKVDETRLYQPAELVTRAALDWLDGDDAPKDGPFFLFLHYMDTHDPYMAADKPGVGYGRAYLGDFLDPDEYHDLMVAAYIDEIEYFDTHFGKLLGGLRERGLYENALILFASDHGEEFYEHQGWWHGQTLYDEMLYVPLIIKLPGSKQAGRTATSLVRHVDIAPSLLQLAGITPPEEMAGKPLFRGDKAIDDQEISYAYAESIFEGNELQAVRTLDAKLILAPAFVKRRFEHVEFYDIRADPHEQTNLAGQRRPGQQALQAVLEDVKVYIENAGRRQ